MIISMQESHRLTNMNGPQNNRFESGRNGSGSSYPNFSAPPTYQPQPSYPDQGDTKPPSLIPTNPGFNRSGDWTRNMSIQLPVSDPRLEAGSLMRTPSPTPSEQRALQTKTSLTGINWKSFKENMGKKEFWMRKQTLIRGAGIVVAIVLTVMLAVFHDQIVNGLTPAGQYLKSHTGGWLVPVGILVILSFPPLFGHEIIGLLCGVIWGLGVGFGIVALGTLLGELANYYVFKHWCTARGEKYEKKNLKFACLARAIRDGGFKVALVVRYSLIPPHFTTTVFATVGMDIGIFFAAAVLSLPKQFVTVYLGTIFEESVNGTTRRDKIISAVIVIIAGVISVFAAKYVSRRVDAVKADVIYERRKARQTKGVAPTPSSDVSNNTFYA